MSASFSDDQELFDIARRELFTAVVGDIMDQLGFYQQFLPPQIKPLSPEMVVIGRAMPALEADYLSANQSEETHNHILNQPFGLMLHALDNLKPHEVYICAGASPTYALWGELMTTRAQMLRANGAVLNGYMRDTRGVLALNFPVFAYGSYAQDQAPRGKVIDFRLPILIDQVTVKPHDIVFGDIDGVCIVPREAEEEVFRLALEKARGEKTVKKAIENGMSASEAFRTFGIM